VLLSNTCENLSLHSLLYATLANREKGIAEVIGLTDRKDDQVINIPGDEESIGNSKWSASQT
jgi:hypothetical protein